MAKQKIVVKVTMNNEKKARKALKIAVSVCGVESASFIGSDKDQIVVTGEGIDPVELAKSLRKSVGCTEIVSVGPVNEKKTGATASQTQPPVVVVPWDVYPPPHICCAPCHIIEYEGPSYNDTPCRIM